MIHTHQQLPRLETSPIPATMHFAVLALASLAVFATAPAQAQQPPKEIERAATLGTDVTFAFTADVHTSFDGHDDHQGILDMVNTQRVPAINIMLIGNETQPAVSALSTHSDACLGAGFEMVKDLCNQIQLVRKLNHLPGNSWDGNSHVINGHPTTLAGAGKTIGMPKGLLIGGDLTDCGAGSDDVNVGLHSENCDVNYGNGTPGAQLLVFTQLFDNWAGAKFYPLNGLSVIQGLKNPDGDTPLKYPVYPGLGNHDLGFDQSGMMMSYIREWNPKASFDSPRHVSSNHNDSGVYALDWGKVHVINAGVFAGSNNHSGSTGDTNYPYDQNVMDWIANDLKTNASDGRPVILVQHFGFDPTSWSSNWYLGGSAAEGAQKLWAMLAPYNVVGIFHGHNHEQAFYSFHPGELWASGVAFPTSHAAYDIFDPGPGFGQDFIVAHVTDKSMDAQATLWRTDYDNSSANPSGTVPFGLFFNKRLVQPPTSGILGGVEGGDSIATSVVYDGSRYLLGATPNRGFTLRRVTGTGTPLVVSTGSFPVTPKFLVSYTVGKLAYILVSDGSTVVSYRIGANLTLQMQWSQVAQLHSMVPVMSAKGLPYLLVDEFHPGSVRLQYYQLSTTGMMLAGSSLDLGGAYAQNAQMFSVPTADTGFTIVRYVPSGGAEIYHGWVDIYGDTVLELMSTEIWVGDSTYFDPFAARPNVFIQPVTLADNTTAFLVKSPSCQVFNTAGTCDTADTEDSPFFVRTLTQDGYGTQVSWRGQIPGVFNLGVVSFVPMDPVNGAAVVGVYSSIGLLSTISVLD